MFLQNLAPGAATDGSGMGAEELREGRPRLITVDMSGYGPGGPYSQKKAYDMLVQSEAGLIATTGSRQRPLPRPEWPLQTSPRGCTPSPGSWRR